MHTHTRIVMHSASHMYCYRTHIDMKGIKSRDTSFAVTFLHRVRKTAGRRTQANCVGEKAIFNSHTGEAAKKTNTLMCIRMLYTHTHTHTHTHISFDRQRMPCSTSAPRSGRPSQTRTHACTCMIHPPPRPLLYAPTHTYVDTRHILTLISSQPLRWSLHKGHTLGKSLAYSTWLTALNTLFSLTLLSPKLKLPRAPLLLWFLVQLCAGTLAYREGATWIDVETLARDWSVLMMCMSAFGLLLPDVTCKVQGMLACMDVYIYIYIYIYIYECIYVYIHIYECVCIYIYTHTYIHTHIYM
jgi:hypothetical protein